MTLNYQDAIGTYVMKWVSGCDNVVTQDDTARDTVTLCSPTR